MLEIMRKNASSLLIKIIFSVIVIVFVFWGVGSFQENRADRVALVNGQAISFDAYRNAYNTYVENLKSQYGNNLSQEILDMFQVPKTVINSLINRELLIQEAEKLNIQVTDPELVATIQGMDVFQEDGVFDSQRYVRLLELNGLTQEMFEIERREEMLIDKLHTFITSAIKVTDGEIREWYEWINASIDIEYALFDPNSIDDLEPTEEELTEYFRAHDENYRTQPQVRVRYLAFSPDNFIDEATIGDEDVLDYYEGNLSEFETEKTVEARHILLSVDEDADPEVVEEKLEKAGEILQMAKDGRDFAELAKEYSEGATRETGGLLGEFKKADMVAPFSEAAFSMEEGELSEPVRTQFGWHLIKVEKVNEASVKTLADVKDQILNQLTEEASREIAFGKADAAFDQALSDDDLEKAAVSLGMTLQSTDYFTSSGPDSGVSDPQAFAEAAFELAGTDISDVLNIGENYYILQKTGELSAEVPEFEEVREQVKSDVLVELQDEAAHSKAEEFLSAAMAGGGLENAAGASGVVVKSSGLFKRSDSIPDIGYETEIIEAAFLLTDDNKVAKQVFKGSGGYYVVQLKERKSPDAEELDTQKDTIKTQLMSQKQQIVFNNWLETLMAESEITVEDGYLD
jgi:peptidyl-prolyl cis-trans isomerase D